MLALIIMYARLKFKRRAPHDNIKIPLPAPEKSCIIGRRKIKGGIIMKLLKTIGAVVVALGAIVGIVFVVFRYAEVLGDQRAKKDDDFDPDLLGI